jgi:hypothetical protein
MWSPAMPSASRLILAALVVAAQPARAGRTEDSDRHYRAATEMARAHRYEEAIAEYQLAIGQKPTNPLMVYDLAEAERNAGQPEQARDHYKLFLRLSPMSPLRFGVKAQIARMDAAARARPSVPSDAESEARWEELVASEERAAPAPAAPSASAPPVAATGERTVQAPAPTVALTAPIVVRASAPAPAPPSAPSVSASPASAPPVATRSLSASAPPPATRPAASDPPVAERPLLPGDEASRPFRRPRLHPMERLATALSISGAAVLGASIGLAIAARVRSDRAPGANPDPTDRAWNIGADALSAVGLVTLLAGAGLLEHIYLGSVEGSRVSARLLPTVAGAQLGLGAALSF